MRLIDRGEDHPVHVEKYWCGDGYASLCGSWYPKSEWPDIEVHEATLEEAQQQAYLCMTCESSVSTIYSRPRGGFTG